MIQTIYILEQREIGWTVFGRAFLKLSGGE
jgi:hypothetical protein